MNRGICMKNQNVCLMVVAARPKSTPKGKVQRLTFAQNRRTIVAGASKSTHVPVNDLTTSPAAVAPPGRPNVSHLHLPHELVTGEPVGLGSPGEDSKFVSVPMAATATARMRTRADCRPQLRAYRGAPLRNRTAAEQGEGQEDAKKQRSSHR